MINTDIKFRADFYNSTKKLSLTDVIATGYDTLLTGYNETHDNIVGIFKAQAPSGVIYGGTAYNNNDFSSPDVNGATPDWLKDNITLPTSGSEILCGSYTLSYKSRLTLVNTLTGYASGYFTVTGEDYTTLLGATPTGLKIQIYSVGSVTGHEGTYDLTSVAESGGDTRFTCAGVTPFTASADDRIAIIFENTNTLTFCFTSPTPDLSTESSCIYSTLTATDDSDYTYNFTGYGSKTPTVTRTWEISCPSNYSATPITGGNVNPITIGYGTSYNAGANIWTGNYIAECTATLSYSMELWGAYTWYVVHDVIVSSKAHDVECDTCFCDIRQCIENLYNKYKEYLNTKPSRATELAQKLFQITTAWSLYGMNERCGTDYTTWCNEITSLVLQEDCQCATDTTVSKEVVPLALQISGGGATGSQITFGAAADGLPLSPNDGDVHVFNTTNGTYNTGDYYWYNGSAWGFQFNNIGATGATGSAGATGGTGLTGSAGANGTTVLFDKSLDTPTQITATSYTLFTDMQTTALTSLASLGDKYEIKASFETDKAGKSTPDMVKIKIDGQDLYFTYIFPTAVIDNQFNGATKSINIVATATVIDVAGKKLLVKYDIECVDVWAKVLANYSCYSLVTVSDLASIVIAAYGKIGATGHVDCRQLSVSFLNK